MKRGHKFLTTAALMFLSTAMPQKSKLCTITFTKYILVQLVVLKTGEAVSVAVFLEVIYDYLDLWVPSNNDIFVVAVFVFRAIE